MGQGLHWVCRKKGAKIAKVEMLSHFDRMERGTDLISFFASFCAFLRLKTLRIIRGCFLSNGDAL
jgi:hypothetical protein